MNDWSALRDLDEVKMGLNILTWLTTLAWVYKLRLHASAQAQALNTFGFVFNFQNNSNKPSSIDIRGDSASVYLSFAAKDAWLSHLFSTVLCRCCVLQWAMPVIEVAAFFIVPNWLWCYLEECSEEISGYLHSNDVYSATKWVRVRQLTWLQTSLKTSGNRHEWN